MSKLNQILIPAISVILILIIMLLFIDASYTGNIPFRYKDKDAVLKELSLKYRRDINNTLNKFRKDQSDTLYIYEALGKIDTALMTLPNDIHIYYLKLEPLIYLKKYEMIDQTISKILNIDPASVTAVELKALLCKKQGKHDSASYYHRKTIQLYEKMLDPSDTTRFILYTYNIAMNEWILYDNEKGLKRLEALLPLYPRKEFYIRNLIELYNSFDKDYFDQIL